MHLLLVKRQRGGLVGLYHDIGKYSSEFQDYLRAGGGRRVDHSTAGALELMNRKSMLSLPAALCVAGHHSGLLNGGNPKVDTEESKSLCGRLKKKPGENIPSYQAYWNEVGCVADNDKSQILPKLVGDTFAGQFYTRMLFSCLVDADFLDTEEFMQAGKNVRGSFASISELKDRLDNYIMNNFLNEKGTRYGEAINQHRRKILRECITAGDADDESSLLSLTVPTGGGKTIASLAFALHHAVLERARRDHPMNIDNEKFLQVSNDLKAAVKIARKADNVEELRGIEGNAASEYFSVFDDLILQRKNIFSSRGEVKGHQLGE